MLSQKSYLKTGPCLYLVPTPIGNLDDMTFRAVQILQDVNMILAEDTRKTGFLLKHFQIDRPLQSFHDHTTSAQVDRWLAYIQEGRQVALVSDAGMPLINDPGHPLVQALLAAEISVIALPGANAALTALIASGLPANQFTYYGFFPRQKKEQEDLLNGIGQIKHTAIFYESPYRLLNSLKRVGQVLGVDCQVVVAREITKKFEEYLRGTCQQLIEQVQEHGIKGECVLLIESEGQISKETFAEELDYRSHVESLMEEQEMTAKEAIKEVARLRQVKKQVVYAAYHGLDQKGANE